VNTPAKYVHHLTVSRMRLLMGLGAYELAEMMRGRLEELLRELNHASDAAELKADWNLDVTVVDVHRDRELQRLVRFANTK
jgi:hypothetical protein